MKLDRIKSLVDSKSYYSRNEVEVWGAINAAARQIYQAVLKEQRGYWIKWDSTSLQFLKDQTQFELPPDVQQLIRVRERASASDRWNLVNSSDSLSDGVMLNQMPVGVNFDDPASNFTFFGPFLTEADSMTQDNTDIESIEITPTPSNTRYVELVYTAKFVEVEDATSYLMIPEDGHDCLIDFAVAECVRPNDDSLAADYAAAGNAKLTSFLTLVRDRQLQDTRTVEPCFDID